MKPYPDQERSINEILTHFDNKQRLLFALATGGGKTACFSFIAQRFIKQHKKKVLIVAHREELILQTAKTLRIIGCSVETVVASKKSLQHHSQVYVAMIQTFKNRLKSDNEFLKDVGLIIVDECHILLHDEIFEYYPNAKILGVTATPVVQKKVYFSRCNVCKKDYETVVDCCGYETYEYTRQFTLSEIYEEIILGTSISELIYNDRLVRELNYEINGIDRNSLTIDKKTGDFDNKSTDEYLSKFDVVSNYEAIAKNKKTIIFNSSAKTNLIVFQSFIERGYTNVKLFDSVNDTDGRKATLEWFKNTSNAILLNVNCFTTGFDEPTTECVILNRATTSLSLFHQMVGRGGRKCNEIYKPHFILIDGGGNVAEHGKWSDEVDWKSHFFGWNEKPKPKKEALDQTKMCVNCGYIHAKNVLICPLCDFEEPPKQYREIVSDKIAVLTDEIPLPNGVKIVHYCNSIGKDKNFAWIILINQIIDLFIRHGVTLGTYKKTQDNGKFQVSIRRIIKEPYQTIQNSNLESGTMRTKAYIINKIKYKLDGYYQT